MVQRVIDVMSDTACNIFNMKDKDITKTKKTYKIMVVEFTEMNC